MKYACSVPPNRNRTGNTKTLKTLAQIEVLRTPEIAFRAQPGSRKGVIHVWKQC